ncbi:MAG: helix-turn-helix domain-containing protein [Alphaproteobacteria bacterium]
MVIKSQFTRLPETMEMADVGPYLRGLREHYKLSAQDVSARLHSRVKYIQAIELGDIEQLPGKVYARGHIASYAEFLGVDPDQTVEKFLGGEAPKKQEFFVPEPLRTDQAARRKWYLWALLLVMALLAYGALRQGGGDESAEIPEVASVPAAMVGSARRLVMPVDDNLRCASGEELAACLALKTKVPVSQPLAAPDIFTAPTPWGTREALQSPPASSILSGASSAPVTVTRPDGAAPMSKKVIPVMPPVTEPTTTDSPPEDLPWLRPGAGNAR